jgi:MoaA/NifB/PqqE/SkfB family radical SAM enzyme
MKKAGFIRFMRNAVRVVKAFAFKGHPFLAQIIPMRKCNLSCAYCNEYEKGTEPVPLDKVKGWIDKLADLGTAHVTISGGEPMMHPELDEIITHIRKRGMIAGLITNGYYLNPKRIRRLNDAGLEYLQISIDNVEPDEVSQKSLNLLDKRLCWLSEHAEFEVNINSVLGAGIKNPGDALVITKRAIELGFKTTVGIIHEEGGSLKPLGTEEQQIYLEIRQLIRRQHGFLMRELSLESDRLNKFQENLVAGKPNEWRCRAGARYLYVDEFGRVQYCSQQRGRLNIPLKDYTKEDFKREFSTEKKCAPFCTISCVHKTAIFDNWRRGKQTAAEAEEPDRL